MFDVGFWELALLAVLALVILGPERLPVVARTLGGWVRRARHFVQNFGEELTGDSSIHELRKEIESLKSEIEGEARNTADRVSRMGNEVSDEVNHMGIRDDLNGHGFADPDTGDDQARSVYEFSVDDVDNVESIPDTTISDTTIADDDYEHASAEDGFEHDEISVGSEQASASSTPDAAGESADSRHDAEDQVSVGNDEQDDELLYARARQQYLASDDDGFDGDEVRSENNHSVTAHAEPADRT